LQPPCKRLLEDEKVSVCVREKVRERERERERTVEHGL